MLLEYLEAEYVGLVRTLAHALTEDARGRLHAPQREQWFGALPPLPTRLMGVVEEGDRRAHKVEGGLEDEVMHEPKGLAAKVGREPEDHVHHARDRRRRYRRWRVRERYSCRVWRAAVALEHVERQVVREERGLTAYACKGHHGPRRRRAVGRRAVHAHALPRRRQLKALHGAATERLVGVLKVQLEPRFERRGRRRPAIRAGAHPRVQRDPPTWKRSVEPLLKPHGGPVVGRASQCGRVRRGAVATVHTLDI